MTDDEDNCIDVNTCENFANAREGIDRETHYKLHPDSEYYRIDDSNDC